MRRKPSPSLIAHKTINLAGDLTASEKRVAAVIIDSYNFKTGQCDPGLNTLSKLLRISRRTVIRAVAKLVKNGYLRKVRHGGYFHRNSYEPVWARFAVDEQGWSAHRKASRFKKRAPRMSLSMEPPCHIDSDTSGIQTYPLNIIPETSDAATALCGQTGGGAKRLDLPSDKPAEKADVKQVVRDCIGVRFAEKCALDEVSRNAIAKGVTRFEESIKPEEFTSWFSKVHFEGNIDGRLHFSAPNTFVRSWIVNNYIFKLEEAIFPFVKGATQVVINVR